MQLAAILVRASAVVDQAAMVIMEVRLPSTAALSLQPVVFTQQVSAEVQVESMQAGIQAEAEQM